MHLYQLGVNEPRGTDFEKFSVLLRKCSLSWKVNIYIYIYIYIIYTAPTSNTIDKAKLKTKWEVEYYSRGASDRSFYPIFNKTFDHLETLLTICRPKKVLSAGSLCGSLVPSPQSKCPKRTFMLPQKNHVSVSNMLSKPLKCFMENEY